jgi:hypothetical protein
LKIGQRLMPVRSQAAPPAAYADAPPVCHSLQQGEKRSREALRESSLRAEFEIGRFDDKRVSYVGNLPWVSPKKPHKDRGSLESL